MDSFSFRLSYSNMGGYQPSILCIIDQRHMLIDYFAGSGLSVAHLFVQMAVGCFLKNRVKCPVMCAVEFFGFPDGGLRVAVITESGHDENGGDAFRRTVFAVDNTDAAHGIIIIKDIVIVCERLLKPCIYFID